MKNNWKKFKIGEILTIKHGFAFKGEYFSPKGDYILLTPGNFYESGGFKFTPGKEKYYLGTFPKEYICKQGDLIVAMTEQADGLLGSTAIVPTDNLYLHNQRVGLISFDREKTCKSFLFYLFRSKSVRKQIKGTASGTKVKHTSPERIYDVEVNIPKLFIQEKIAAVLSTLDAKIELNKRINADLEAMVTTIYEYWFVQYDFPDRKGKPFKSSGGNMVWNKELKREIPEGWEIYYLSEIITRSGTGLNPRKNFKLGTGDNYYVTIKNIIDGKIVLDDKCAKISNEALNIINKRSDLKPGDILFTSIEPVGITYFVHSTPANWNINESIFTLRPNYGKITSEFLFMLLSSLEMKAFTKNCSAGSIHKGIRHSVLKTFPLPYGNKDLIDAFSSYISPLLKRIACLDIENQQLTDLRNWLLPMLMNGQVTVA